MMFLAVVIGLGCIVGWFLILFRGIALAIDDAGWRAWSPWFATSFLVLAAGVTFLLSRDGDPYPNLLCLSGHQQWVIVSNGKTTSREKAWVCDQRESR